MSILTRRWLQHIVAASMGLAIGILTDVRAFYGLIPAGIPYALLLLGSADLRLIVSTVGGISVFGSSSDLSIAKTAFLCVFLFSALISVHRALLLLGEHPSLEFLAFMKSMVWFALLLFATIILSLLRGIKPIDVLLDSFPYLLFVLFPFLALDFSNNASRFTWSIVLPLTLIIGDTSAALSWISRRGYLTQTDVSGYSGTVVLMGTFAYLTAKFTMAEEKLVRLKWLVLSCVVFAAYMATGTREAIEILLAPLIQMAILYRRMLTRILSFGKFLFSVLIAGGASFIVLLTVLRVNISDVTHRLAQISVLFNGRLASDQSFIGRRLQTHLTAAEVQTSPIIGADFGHQYLVPLLQGGVRAQYTMDSPLILVAHFGIIGTIVATTTYFVMLWCLRVYYSRYGVSAPLLAMIGFLTVTGLAMLINDVLEDKGLFIILVLLFSQLLRHRGEIVRRRSDDIGSLDHA